MKDKKLIKKILYWSIVSVLILIIVACASVLGWKAITDARDVSINEELQDLRNDVTKPTLNPNITNPSQTEPTTDAEQTEPPQTEPTVPPNIDDTVLFEYQPLYEINRDMVGWIYIEGTAIDYPVVQSSMSQRDFYLRRNFYKQDATCGTIYVREACSVTRPSDNITIYGHNMRNGTMFADLHKYENKSFWEDHRYVWFNTLSEYRAYEIFAVFATTADSTKGFPYHTYDTFATEQLFNEFVSNSKNLSFYDTGITPTYGDEFITLSTCDKTYSNGRLAVVCRRVQ